jgi:hypothetical protein
VADHPRSTGVFQLPQRNPHDAPPFKVWPRGRAKRFRVRRTPTTRPRGSPLGHVTLRTRKALGTSRSLPTVATRNAPRCR